MYLHTNLSQQEVENCIIKFLIMKELCSLSVKYIHEKVMFEL
jgi:hypothetical protein